MNALKNRVKDFLKNEEGQGMVEYGLIIALISIAAITVILLLGPQLTTIFQNALNGLKGTTGS